MGDWRNNKDEEVELDGIGGVNILVKADVHRSGMLRHHKYLNRGFFFISNLVFSSKTQESISHATHSRIKPRRKDLPRWPKEQVIRSSVYRIMSFGISIPKNNLVMLKVLGRGVG